MQKELAAYLTRPESYAGGVPIGAITLITKENVHYRDWTRTAHSKQKYAVDPVREQECEEQNNVEEGHVGGVKHASIHGA